MQREAPTSELGDCNCTPLIDSAPVSQEKKAFFFVFGTSMCSQARKGWLHLAKLFQNMTSMTERLESRSLAPAVQMSLLWPRGKHCRGPANVHRPGPARYPQYVWSTVICRWKPKAFERAREAYGQLLSTR